LEKKFKECEKGDDITPFDGTHGAQINSGDLTPYLTYELNYIFFQKSEKLQYTVQNNENYDTYQ
jgi:hypothetical protein